jgi:hypothetical protein
MTLTSSPTLFTIRPRFPRRGRLILALAVLLGLAEGRALLAQPNLPRVARQIRIMEKVIDQVLVESRHARVTGAPNCKGMRLNGYGVLFIVELSPISSEGGMYHFQFKEDGSYNVILDEDEADKERLLTEGRIRKTGRRDADDSSSDIEYDDNYDDDEDRDREEEEREKAEERKDQKEEKKDREREKQRLKELVARMEDRAARGAGAGRERETALDQVREELVGVIRDYGHTITGLGPEEYVAIAIFPSDLDWRAPDTRTIIQVKRRAIDAYNDSQLSSEEFAKQLEVITQ